MMTVRTLIWLEVLRDRFFGRRNPLRLFCRQVWFDLTEIPLMWAARKELVVAVAVVHTEQHQLKNRLHPSASNMDRFI
jgi:hypothetical protein